MEIDFLIRRAGKISPNEVKSSGYQHHASLDEFAARCERDEPGRAAQVVRDVAA